MRLDNKPSSETMVTVSTTSPNPQSVWISFPWTNGAETYAVCDDIEKIKLNQKDGRSLRLNEWEFP